MNLGIISEIVELGGIVVISIIAIYSLFWIIKNKKNINGDNAKIDEIKKSLASIKGNHLGTINTKTDFLIKQTASNGSKLDKIIVVLTKTDFLIEQTASNGAKLDKIIQVLIETKKQKLKYDK